MIEKLLDDDEGVVDRRVAPSLLKLLHDQAALIDPSKIDREGEAGLRSGFVDRRGVIMWYQRASVRTLGHLAESWDPVDCVVDETLLSALVTFSFSGIEPMGEPQASKYRQVLETDYVIPACRSAFRELRTSASEYIRQPGESGEAVNPANRNLDPAKQQYVAMRPGFQTLDKQQKLALEELWGGFGDVHELEDWILGLNSPSNGEIGEGLAERTVNDVVAVGYLVEAPDTREARQYQDFYAATQVLPAFVDAVKTIETGELAKARKDSPTTLRMKGGQHE